MRIVALIVSLLLVGNLLATAKDNSIIFLRPTDALSLDPWQANDAYSSEVIANIFEGLVRFKKNSTAVEPCLASAWEARENGKKWVFTLRPGVRFHDGSELNVRDVVDSLQSRLGKKQSLYKRSSFLFSSITSIHSNNNTSIEIILNRPYAPFLIALADSAAFIVPTAARKSSGFLPIGTGPLRFSSWTKGKSLILTRNPDYWGGRVNLEKVVFKVMPDSLGRILQIKNGSADIISIQSAKEYEELTGRREIAILSNPSLSTHYLGFNTKKKPFDQLEARAAFRHLFNKESLVKLIFQNLAIPAYVSLPLPLFPTEKKPFPNDFDLELAKNLMKKAGYEKGFDCSLYFADGQEGIQEIADHLTICAKKVKINLKKIKLPFAELVKIADRGEHDLLILGWSTGPDADFFLYPLFTLGPGNRNRFFYENSELTSLLDEGRTMMDLLKREQIYRHAMAILEKDIPLIPLFHLNNIIAYNKVISGLTLNSLGYTIFKDVTKEPR
jgi:peptide/nickel transport system substrate-binding protein